MGLVDATPTDSTPGFGITLGNGRLLFGLGAGPIVTTLKSGLVADDKWHHVSARRVQESGQMTLFVDGLAVAEGSGATNLLDTLPNITIGSLTGGTQYFVGNIDQLRTWSTLRTDEQIAADFHSTRSTHGFAEEAPEVQIVRGIDSVQVFWDALSGYRILEGATAIDGSYLTLPTDQNSTNITKGAGTRFYRVRR
jgi:hypothetical protein